MKQHIKNASYGYSESRTPKWSVEAIMEYDDKDLSSAEATQTYIDTLEAIIKYHTTESADTHERRTQE